MTHICVSKLTIIGSDNGLLPGRRQAIIWTNARMLLIGPLGTNFSEILIGIQTFSFKKLHLKTSSAKWRLFCPGLNELMALQTTGCMTLQIALISDVISKCVMALQITLGWWYYKQIWVHDITNDLDKWCHKQVCNGITNSTGLMILQTTLDAWYYK